VKTPSSIIPSAEEEQLNTLEGECTENKRNLIKEIWNTEPSLSNNQSENDTQNGMFKIYMLFVFIAIIIKMVFNCIIHL